MSTRAANLEPCAETAQRAEMLPLLPPNVNSSRISHSKSAGMPEEQDALPQLQSDLEWLQYRVVCVCLRKKRAMECFWEPSPSKDSKFAVTMEDSEAESYPVSPILQTVMFKATLN